MNKNEKIVLYRTDLAKDDYETYESSKIADFENVELQYEDIPITRNDIGIKASEILNKPSGTYFTIDLSNLDIHDTETCENIEKALSTVLKQMLEEMDLINKKGFIVGLGNSNVTPDAIGPIVIDNTVVTRHLDLMNVLSDGFSSISAMSPGVMGTTGIETYDIIESVLSKIDVDYLIVVDALATNSIKRVNKTIQITNTGIKPGSGVGNKRKELSFNTLNKPVIAIGVPTVVDAATITVDTIQMVLKYLHLDTMGKTSIVNKFSPTRIKENLDNVGEIDSNHLNAYMGPFGTLNEEEMRTLVSEILTPEGYNLMVTPKEIDIEVEDLSKIIANGINLAVHTGLYDKNFE